MPSGQTIFRQQALDHQQSFASEGKVIRVAAPWAGITYWILVWAVLAALLYLVTGTINEYASGPAVVRIDGSSEMTAHARGTVGEVLVSPGQRVKRGTVLLRFHLAEEVAERQGVERIHKKLLLRLLVDPGDQEARNEIGALQARRELALARLAERLVMAPHDGVVSDLRARAGQAVEPGDRLVTVTGDQARGRMLVLVPAQYRPLLSLGMQVRLLLRGFPFAYQTLRVDGVGEEAIGPAEVKRFLGPDSADTVAVDGPVVMVEVSLASPHFVSAGQRYRYFDGMLGSAEVRLRSDSIAAALVPGLRDLVHGTGRP